MALISHHSDTIVALATPAGPGAIAVMRISGKDALEVADKVFVSKGKKRLSHQKSHTLHLGFIRSGKEDVDEVLASVFHAPNSYTGENSVEISCHGSTYVQQKVLETIIGAGARLAQPGEFTLRAFLNGKMDLTQAEAVADLIAADSSSAHHLALKQMRGGFSSVIKNLRDQLIHFASLLELELDFAEEDVEFANRDQLNLLSVTILAHISKLIISFQQGNVIRNGVPVAIAGKPNAGKSTLLNTLLNEERAIVTDIAGTTRDTIEETIHLGGISFHFIDTAGIRSTEDVIESIGVSKTYEKLGTAAIVIYLFDPKETSPAELDEILADLKKNKTDKKALVIPIANKADQYNEELLRSNYAAHEELIYISARNKTNIETLKALLITAVHADKINLNNAIVTNARHVEALVKAHKALEDVLDGLDANLTTDLIASNIRTALHYLGEITGEITTDNLLENIFSKFCIGK